MAEKVFCVGLNKTGTTSLNQAFETLGLKTFHDAYKAEALFQLAIQRNEPLLTYLDGYDCFSDSPFWRYYVDLALDYPDAKFILNTRPVDEWVASRIKHDESWERAHPNKPPRQKNPELLTKFMLHHNERVRTFFEGSDNFIEFNVTADGWVPLCRILGRTTIPYVPFPHSNKAGELFGSGKQA